MGNIVNGRRDPRHDTSARPRANLRLALDFVSARLDTIDMDRRYAPTLSVHLGAAMRF